MQKIDSTFVVTEKTTILDMFELFAMAAIRVEKDSFQYLAMENSYWLGVQAIITVLNIQSSPEKEAAKFEECGKLLTEYMASMEQKVASTEQTTAKTH